MPTHPDVTGGLGFGGSACAYSPLLTALGAHFAGFIANRIFHDAAVLTAYQAGKIILLAGFGPAARAGSWRSSPHILEGQAPGVAGIGCLRPEYSRSFLSTDGCARPIGTGKTLLGAADIQSSPIWATPTPSSEIRAPFEAGDMFLQLVLATVASLPAPCLLTLFSFDAVRQAGQG